MRDLGEVPSIEPGDLRLLITEITVAMFESVERLLRLNDRPSDEDIHLLCEPIVRLIGIHEMLSHQPPRRPFVNDSLAFVTIANELIKGWGNFIAAYSARDIDDVTTLSADFQSNIDRAQDAWDRHEVWTNSNPLDSWDPGEALTPTILGSLLGDATPDALAELTTEAQHNSATTLGIELNANDALEWRWLNLIGQYTFDSSSFNAKIRAGINSLIHSPVAVNILEQKANQDHILRSSRLLLEASQAFSYMITRSRDDGSTFRHVLAWFGNVYENTSLPLFAIFLASTGLKQKPVELLMTDDASDLATTISNRGPDGLLRDPVKHLRHAAHHGHQWTLEGNSVEFKLRSYSRTSDVYSVIDNMLEFFESVVAIRFALQAASALLDIPYEGDPIELQYLHLDSASISGWILESRFPGSRLEPGLERWRCRLATEKVPSDFAVAFCLNASEHRLSTIEFSTLGAEPPISSVTLRMSDYREHATRVEALGDDLATTAVLNNIEFRSLFECDLPLVDDRRLNLALLMVLAEFEEANPTPSLRKARRILELSREYSASRATANTVSALKHFRIHGSLPKFTDISWALDVSTTDEMSAPVFDHLQVILN